jgi:hypothetical protein
MTQTALSEGTRAGGVLAVWTIVLAVLGLTPAFSWVPEVPLLTVGAAVPAVVLGFTGFRVAFSSRRIAPGVIASALAGAISGGVGGLAYVAFGKPLLNVAAGLVLGAVGGAVLGALGSLVGVRSSVASTPRP